MSIILKIYAQSLRGMKTSDLIHIKSIKAKKKNLSNRCLK